MLLLTHFCLVSGIGTDSHAISSFDSALLDAGIGNYNLVRVSSILPPNCVQSNRVLLPGGSVLFTAYATLTTHADELIASAIAVAIPHNAEQCGVIMEYSNRTSKEDAVKTVRKLAENAMRKRHIAVDTILSSGIEIQGKDTVFSTTFAGISMF